MKSNLSVRRGITAVCALGLIVVASAASFLSVDQLLRDSKKHDKKEVTVRGRVEQFRERTSQRGNKYTTFQLKGERQTVNVYLRDHLSKDPKNGTLVEVKGIFQLAKRVGDRVFKNEVDASKKEGKRFGVRILDSNK